MTGLNCVFFWFTQWRVKSVMQLHSAGSLAGAGMLSMSLSMRFLIIWWFNPAFFTTWQLVSKRIKAESTRFLKSPYSLSQSKSQASSNSRGGGGGKSRVSDNRKNGSEFMRTFNSSQGICQDLSTSYSCPSSQICCRLCVREREMKWEGWC